jgi:CheY-like chemotaxis protein
VKRAQDAEVAAIAPRIEQSARAQLKMVNDLLDFGRIGMGKLRITLRQVKLSTLAAMAVDAARPAAEAKGLSLSLEPSGAGTVVGDPDRLMQVVSNLLSNATKFTPRGGRVVVRVRERPEYVDLSVVDSGQGIDASLLPHVFDRFTQGDSSTTRSAGGLGLGLTLVREIVALHGGTVAAESEGRDRGSIFTVTLPAARSPSSETAPDLQSQQPATSVNRRLTGLSILVVDDEADARAVVAETLRLEGASVTVGDCARAALAHLHEQELHFDVIVTDIGMPEEDGYSLVRKLRALPAREKIVAIALTGYASRADIETAIDAGFDLHVAKPVDFDSFVPLIRRLARQT